MNIFGAKSIYFVLLFLFLHVAILVEAQVPDFISNLSEQSIDKRTDEVKQAIGEMNIGENLIFQQSGICSYYGKRFHNRKTSNGERFDMFAFSAAHKELPFGMILKVTNETNKKSILVRVNDRGPFKKNRILDLSYYAADFIEAKGIQNIQLKSFKPDLSPIGNSQREIYYYGFSTTRDLVCLPSSVIDVIRKSSDFDEIMTEYIHYLENNPDTPVFIFVPTDYLSRTIEGDNSIKYTLAKVDTSSQPYIGIELATEMK